MQKIPTDTLSRADKVKAESCWANASDADGSDEFLSGSRQRRLVWRMEERKTSLAADFRNIFSDESGRRVLKHLGRFCLEDRTTFVENEPYKTAFNEGARSVILEIKRKLKEPEDKPEKVKSEGVEL